MIKVNLKRTAAATALLTVMLLSACAGKSPPVDFYTLSAAVPSADASAAGTPCSDTVIAIGPVNWPRYLDQPRIVTRTGPNRLGFDEFHRWAGSLSDDFERVLIKNLAGQLQSELLVSSRRSARFNPAYRVELVIQQFDGELGGDVVLDVKWGISPTASGKPDSIHSTTLREPTTGPDYDALVSASSRATARLSQDIATELNNRCTTSP